jgi:hypothetical protein
LRGQLQVTGLVWDADAEHLEPGLEDDAGQVCVGLDGVVYLVQGFQIVERRGRQPLPVGLWQSIEGLSS